MALTLSTLNTEPVAPVADRNALEDARRTIRAAVQSTILRDRDRLQTQVDHLEDTIRRFRSAHRHELGIRCDDCKAMLTVSTSDEPEPGALAQTLLALGMTMRWRFAPSTSAELTALSGVAWQAMMAGVSTPGVAEVDRCASCARRSSGR